MALTKEKKQGVISEYRINKRDTGSAEVQIAILTERINGLTGHFAKHAKDHHSRYGLIKMVNKRKTLLTVVQKNDQAKYKEIITRLDLRK